jgi:hypothetical protein
MYLKVYKHYKGSLAKTSARASIKIGLEYPAKQIKGTLCANILVLLYIIRSKELLLFYSVLYF